MSLRELVAMAEARAVDNWHHTSAVLAMLANCHRDPKKGRAFRPDDFHPLTGKQSEKIPPKATKGSFAILKHVFVDRRRKKKK